MLWNITKWISFWVKIQDFKLPCAGHSTDFQVGGDNSKVEGGSCKTRLQNKAVFYFHFDIFIFENKVAGEKMQLDRQFARLLWNALTYVEISSLISKYY